MHIASPPPHFDNLNLHFQRFSSQEFKNLSARKKFKEINFLLLDLIRNTPPQSFLLPHVIHYIKEINQLEELQDKYTLALFEFWLNHYSGISSEEQAQIRGKIVGKWVPRDEYQRFFPIGMGKTFYGTHFVAAHLSPDVDTMIASFWGWADAFAARVGTGQHLWNLPGGPPESPVTRLFERLFGDHTFAALARTIPTLTLTSMDLLSNNNVHYKYPGISISTLDHSEPQKAIILNDKSDFFLGDWRSPDVEPTRQVVILFKSCLRWFESNLQLNLIALFAHERLTRASIPLFLEKVFDIKIQNSEPYQEFDSVQKKMIAGFITEVLGERKGVEASFREFAVTLSHLGAHELLAFIEELSRIETSPLFDSSGGLVESRATVFEFIQKVLKEFDYAIHHIRDFAERLDIVVKIKHSVLGTPSTTLGLRSDIDEIRLKIRNLDYLPVTVREEADKAFSLGVIWANDLRKPFLGTVSFRDFCNLDEVKMASYLGVISVIDHHKTSLNTGSTPMAVIGDAQSCNVLIAEIAFEINDLYSTGGISLESIEEQISAFKNAPFSESDSRKLSRLMLKRRAAQNPQPHFIHPLREYYEYFLFLHAILDDTDLLNKMSKRDVDCVVQLLNRIKTLSTGQESETVTIDDIPLDDKFAKTASKRILQNPDMHAIYNEIFQYKEKEVEANLKLAAEGKYSNIFADTKEQNGCCRISQTKLFSSNYPLFVKNHEQIVKEWLRKAEEVCRNHPEIDLHIHMVSTIPSADEVYSLTSASYTHQDELWFWRPKTQTGYEHLSLFLSNFQSALEVINNEITVEFFGEGIEELKEIFRRNFSVAKTVQGDKKESNKAGEPVAIVHVRAGSINSRKAMISPYLPKLIA